jgi:hypothetical protein
VTATAVTDPLAAGLPRRLHAARARKGVDLHRAERDTKIRARYLEALERGDWRALPGAVYTKGFLRNYAVYLGLDPEEVLRDWRHDRGAARVLRGTSVAGATISVATPGREQPYRVTTSPDGSWSIEVDLRRGRNQFDVSAVDPGTRMVSETVAHVFITVQ